MDTSAHYLFDLGNILKTEALDIKRARSNAESTERAFWDGKLTFCAQGAGQHENSYHLGEIRMHRESIDTGVPIDVELVAKAAQAQTSNIDGKDGIYRLSGTTQLEAAQILDSIFRNHLKIRPFADEGDDYAIGAEW
jgi:hypothetical protein